MQRVANGYLRMLNKEVKKHLPEIMALYKRERHDDANYDDTGELIRALNAIFQKIAQALEEAIAAYDLRTQVTSIANIAKNTSIREWRRTVKRTLGINLMTDYYNGSFYEDILQQWIAKNVSQIQSLSSEELSKVESVISDGFTQGRTIRDIAKGIQKECDVSKKKAVFLARDQVGTLNSQITRRQHEDAGVTEYEWSTSHDERVRPCHKEFDGKKFRWDDPPEIWTETKDGIVMTGRRCNPGEDYYCRCCAIPVFNIDTTDLPIQTEETKEETSVSIGGFGM